VDPAPELSTEDVVDEPMLGDPAQPPKLRRGDHSVEVVAVARDLCAGTRNRGFDALL